MRVTDLKMQVAHGAYQVDEQLVAEAVLRRLAPLRFALLPPSSRRGDRSQPKNPRPRH